MLTYADEQLLMAERREKAQREHFEQVGKDNHATIKNLTDDLRFLARTRLQSCALREYSSFRVVP